ncbi:MAG: ABC transporter permease [Alphaproteobacteria bacterium]|nr:ABC transporter permease [Alphaproteobacteria bacterium]
MTLGLFLLRRLVMILPMALFIVFCTFMLVRISGQDPIHLLTGPTASAAEIALVRSELGLDQPIWAQFGLYLLKLLRGDLGNSWITGDPVLGDVLACAPATLELMIWGVLLGALIGIPAGLGSATRPGGTFDQVTRTLSLLGFSIPTYWLGLVMMFVFFYLLGWAPPGIGRIGMMHSPPPTVTGSYLIDALLAAEWGVAHSAFGQLVLPVVCVTIIAAAPIIKQTRAIAIEVRASDAVRYAVASGLPLATERRIVLRNSATPLLTFIATEFTGLVGTTSLIEYVFAWGGLGQYGLTAITSGDFTAVQGYVLAIALFAALVLLVTDLIVIVIEPRASLRP